MEKQFAVKITSRENAYMSRGGIVSGLHNASEYDAREEAEYWAGKLDQRITWEVVETSLDDCWKSFFFDQITS